MWIISYLHEFWGTWQSRFSDFHFHYGGSHERIFVLCNTAHHFPVSLFCITHDWQSYLHFVEILRLESNHSFPRNLLLLKLGNVQSRSGKYLSFKCHDAYGAKPVPVRFEGFIVKIINLCTSVKLSSISRTPRPCDNLGHYSINALQILKLTRLRIFTSSWVIVTWLYVNISQGATWIIFDIMMNTAVQYLLALVVK